MVWMSCFMARIEELLFLTRIRAYWTTLQCKTNHWRRHQSTVIKSWMSFNALICKNTAALYLIVFFMYILHNLFFCLLCVSLSLNCLSVCLCVLERAGIVWKTDLHLYFALHLTREPESGHFSFFLLLIQEGQLLVTYKSMCTYPKVLKYWDT